MTSPVQEPVTIDSYLDQPLRVGEPELSGPMAIYPVFGPPPRQVYISMTRAHSQGFTVKELPGGASVRDLIVSNPGPHAVLLFEGEEVLGAQQNRTLDSSVLIAAGSDQQVPVSCVEAGRWDGRRSEESFQPASHASHPELRREKAKQAARARSAGSEARADQGEVWAHVDERSKAMNVSSITGSMNDVYESRNQQLADLVAGVSHHEGQIGMLIQVGPDVFALDLVSRPDVMADLHGPLVTGYALDALALGGTATAKADQDLASEFVSRATATRILERDGVGLGRDFRFEDEALVGSGLVAGDELVQISVFPSRRASEPSHGAAADNSAIRPTRIGRPSRRRR